MTLAFHPVADLFPMMAEAEFAGLVADIAEHGQREPILTHCGQIIDGRNRYKACLELGLTPVVREWEGTGSLVECVVSMNLHRRHLDSGQKAMVAQEILPLLEEEAKTRQQAAGGDRKSLSQRFDEAISQPKAAEQAARIVGTNRQYVADAKRIIEQAPDLATAVKNGEMKITEARRQLQRRKLQAETPALPPSTYRVLYADPPWKYGNQGLDDYGHAERHYPALSIEELCALDVRSLADADAVLFLWVTSPLLREAFRVVDAWGFQYKTSFVWDKVRHNFGYYNSVRHEFLLVCTRGSCLPDVQTLFDSVQSHERTEHSVKPAEFRTIIETLYTQGRRIELFARQPAPGWDVWGNEVDAC